MEQKPKRERMKAISETMRGWAEGLRAEIEGWPGVTLKHAFGMTLVYRAGVVFAALPSTRALYEQDAILLKFMKEPAAVARRIAAETRFAGTMESRRTSQRKAAAGPRKPASQGRKWRIFRMRRTRMYTPPWSGLERLTNWLVERIAAWLREKNKDLAHRF